jgi:hypothetical protein
MSWDMNQWENERDEQREELAAFQKTAVDPVKSLSTDAIIKTIRANLSPSFRSYIDELTYRFEL